MPGKAALQRARRDAREGKAPSTQAGEFVREEMHHIREGKHGARNTKQAIAIGLSKARRAGVDLPPPAPGKTSRATRRKARQDLRRGKSAGSRRRAPSPTRSRATKQALRKESRRAASHRALSRQARQSSRRRSSRGSARQPARHTRHRRSMG